MKKRCIKAATGISKGQDYEVIDRPGDFYVIRNNNNSETSYYKWRFEDIPSTAPISFCIVGNPKQLAAIYDDLLDLGYTRSYNSGSIPVFKNLIATNATKASSSTSDAFKQIYINGSFEPDFWEIAFQLPQQYSEAWQFAKDQLKSLKPKEVKITIGDPAKEITIYPDRVVVQGGYTISKESIESLRGHLASVLGIGGVGTLNVKEPSVWIGCEEGSRATLNELEKVLETINSLK